jgi:cytochrome c
MKNKLLLTLFLAFLVIGFSSPSHLSFLTGKVPDETRYNVVVLAEGPELDEPMAFEVLDDERVLFIERKGGFKVYDPAIDAVTLIATIPVNTKYTSASGQVREAEEGLVGFTVDPNFEENNWVYMLYADPDAPQHVLARWELRDNQLIESSKVVMLEFPVQREACCHTGGGMAWDADGNLFITVGNNTGNSQSSQTDERPNRSSWDDQRGAANTNDLRGKILRIHPEPDGTYTIPEGNLFPPGTPDTRPEIYTMGHRNAWRVSVDSETGFIYWGEVGPDASADTEIGPRGYDELNQARGPGFFGWPYFIGENHAYPIYDFVADTTRAPKDPARPTNTSVNNTGMEVLPPAQPAFISYPYGFSEKFPLVGTGGRSATGGPVFRRADYEDAERLWPDYFEGKWIAADLARGWIMLITMDEDGNYVSMERFLPDYNPSEIIDLKFGPEGDLYILEYGETWFADGQADKLVRIEYNAGNRAPVASASADKTGGSLPLQVSLSSEGTLDYDSDPLQYRWEIVSENGGAPRVFNEANPTVTIDRQGVYTANLTVTDQAGASSSESVRIIAGNSVPVITMNMSGNRTFYFPGSPISYSVAVSDSEDGGLADGRIAPGDVAVSFDYVSGNEDYADIAGSQPSVDRSGRYAVAQALMSQSDCSVCHQVDIRSAGPSFTEIAQRYRGDVSAADSLARKIRAGGSGVWGEVMMPAHPAITLNDATTMARYILSIGNEALTSLPLSGVYVPPVLEDDIRGDVIVRAAYEDRGAGAVPAQLAEEVIVLRSPQIDLGSANVVQDVDQQVGGRGAGPVSLSPKAGGYVAFNDIDLSGIRQIQFNASASARNGNVGGTIEVRLDSPTGELLGEVEVAVPVQGGGGGGGGNNNAPLVVNIEEPISGMRNVYFVFKNDTAAAMAPLMTVSGIRFNN